MTTHFRVYYEVWHDSLGHPRVNFYGGNTGYVITRHHSVPPRTLDDAHCIGFNECVARCMDQRKDAGAPAEPVRGYG